MTLESILVWILLVAVAGWLVGQISKGHGFGLRGNNVVGVLGSFIGEWLGDQIGVSTVTSGFILSSIITVVVGVLVLLFMIGLLKKVS